MSVSSTLGTIVAVAQQSADPGAAAQTGLVFGQAQEVAQLLASLQPQLGQNVNMTA